jgi:hypothetical protein
LVFVLVLSVSILPFREVRAVPFIRGDVDANGSLEMPDAIRLLGFLFLGAPRFLTCKDAADANDSGELDLSDGVPSSRTFSSAVLSLPLPTQVVELILRTTPSTAALAFCPVPFCERTASQVADIDVGGHNLRFESRGHGCFELLKLP